MNFRLPDFGAMYRDMASSSPQLKRGRVWCHKCGHSQQVDSGECLRNGWPKCCGETMSIDSPEERAARCR
jgi:hypothetical protein